MSSAGSTPLSRHFLVDCPTVPGSGNFNFQNLLQGRVDNACRAVTAAMFLSHGMRQDTAVSLVIPHPSCEENRRVCGGGGGQNRGGGGRGQNARPREKTGSVADTPAPRTVTVTWLGSELVGVWPDEKSIATRLQLALCHHFGTPCPTVGNKHSISVPAAGVKGVTVFSDPPQLTAASGFVGAVERAAASAGNAPLILLLDENGNPRSAFDKAAVVWAASNGGSADPSSSSAPSGFVFTIGGPDGLPSATTTAVAAMKGATTLRLPGPSLHAGVVISLVHNVLDTAMDTMGVVVDTAPRGAVEAAAARRVGTKNPSSSQEVYGSSSEQPPPKKQRTERSRTVAQRVEAMYRRYRPDKVHKAGKKLEEWRGDEETLLKELIELWGPEV